MKFKRNYISLFSGAGVGCFGFKMENFDCIATNELIERRLNIQKYNKVCKYQTGYISGDIQNDETRRRLFEEIDKFKAKEKLKDVDVIIATPPCQGMSVANHKKNNEKGRNSLVVKSIEIVNTVKPKFFIFENVKSFLTTICTDLDGSDKPIKNTIDNNLGGHYSILYKVINFKEYGSNSSRTRTLVIGSRKDIINVNPYDLWLELKPEKTLRSVIGDLPPLSTPGDISRHDFYHSFRPYAKYMISWINNLEEGASAFNNTNPKNRPHRIIDGKRFENANKNGDKYRRCIWDRVAPCIHTRNDQLASQSTIHPSDNRVFSIRELMRMMTIPEEFQWLEYTTSELNAFSCEEQKTLLKQNEMNIRQCIGEAVPTEIFRAIAKKINKLNTENKSSNSAFLSLIKKNNLDQTDHLIEFINREFGKYSLTDLFKIIELSNAERLRYSAYYTRQDICFSLINNLPEEKGKNNLKIIEPSVGAGNFLPLLFKKFSHISKVNIDVVDIDKNSISVLRALLNKINIPNNFTINYINQDFLLNNFDLKYDIVIGNPPFGKIINYDLVQKYKLGKNNKKTNNIFSFFIEESIKIGKLVALIAPKSLLSAPEFDETRKLIETYEVVSLFDYGEKAFIGVKIETVGFILRVKKVNEDEHTIRVESNVNNSITIKKQTYIMSKSYPIWLLYRNEFFDNISKTLKLGVFNSFRDRQITKQITKSKGKIRVLKSRNIGNCKVIDIDGYDCYIDDLTKLSVAKYLNSDNSVLVPNLTYNPRACFLPKNSITDGSVAILTPKTSDNITTSDLEYYSTSEFREFYMISKNLGTRSLNIDKNATYFFGIRK